MEDSIVSVMVIFDKETTSKLRYSDERWVQVKKALSKAGLSIEKAVYDMYLILGTIERENINRLLDISFVQTVEIEEDEAII